MNEILFTLFLILNVIQAITLFSIKRELQKRPKEKEEIKDQVMDMMVKLLSLTKDVERIKKEQDQ